MINVDDIPILVGELNFATGIKGFELAQIGHPVFEYNDRYIIFLKSETKTVEMIPDGKGGHTKKVVEYNVIIPYYKKTLEPFIKFIQPQ